MSLCWVYFACDDNRWLFSSLYELLSPFPLYFLTLFLWGEEVRERDGVQVPHRVKLPQHIADSCSSWYPRGPPDPFLKSCFSSGLPPAQTGACSCSSPGAGLFISLCWTSWYFCRPTSATYICTPGLILIKKSVINQPFHLTRGDEKILQQLKI